MAAVSECHHYKLLKEDIWVLSYKHWKGHFPGPVIRVLKGAVVKVNIKNRMPLQAATIHWHGILQTNNYWMDGWV